ncbi:general secretion pathway protein GspB [Eionea flava]
MPQGSLFIFLFLILPNAIASTVVNDPTRPIFETHTPSTVTVKPVVAQTMPLLLQSVFYSAKRKSAIINDTVFKQGEMIDGITLHDVKKRQVVLKYKGQSITLVISEKIYIDKHTGEKREK